MRDNRYEANLYAEYLRKRREAVNADARGAYESNGLPSEALRARDFGDSRPEAEWGRGNGYASRAAGYAYNEHGVYRARGGNDDYAEYGGHRRKKYTITGRGIALLLVFCVVLSGALGVGGAALAIYQMGAPGNAARALDPSLRLSEAGTTLEQATASKLSIQEIVSLTENAVVEISTERAARDSWMNQYVTQGAGSGVIISGNGHIMTNFHVIRNSNKIIVTLKDGRKYTAAIAGADSDTDLAVIKIDAMGLTSVVYGDSDKIQVGDLAVAIGNPLGELGGTATAGIISALDRQLTIEGKKMALLQTDASINPGNSGGGLFDQYGQLIGLVVAKSSGSDVEGLGFAIPVNLAKDVAGQILDYGYVKGRIDTGLTFVDLTSTHNAIFSGVRNRGIYIRSVDNKNAIDAGFQPGDMVYSIGGARIESVGDLAAALQKCKVGDSVLFTVVRGNEFKEMALILDEKKGS